MLAFRFFLLLILASLVGYTGIVIANHGLGVLSFFGDIGKLVWAVQLGLLVYAHSLSALVRVAT